MEVVEIEQYLAEVGTTKADLARAIGRTPQSLYRALSGRQRLRVDPWGFLNGCKTVGADPYRIAQYLVPQLKSANGN